MQIRLLDEVVPVGDKGILLFMDGEETEISPGARLRDARGQEHTISKVAKQEEWLTLFIENGDAAYFERLFRDIRIDATAFELLTAN